MSRGHFEREAWLQMLIPGAIAAVGLLFTLLGTVCFSAIDRARDEACAETGGRYDREAGRCVPDPE